MAVINLQIHTSELQQDPEILAADIMAYVHNVEAVYALNRNPSGMLVPEDQPLV